MINFQKQYNKCYYIYIVENGLQNYISCQFIHADEFGRFRLLHRLLVGKVSSRVQNCPRWKYKLKFINTLEYLTFYFASNRVLQQYEKKIWR